MFQGAELFHPAEIPFSNEQQLKRLTNRSIPTPSTHLEQKLRIKRQIERFVIFLCHLEIRHVHVPYSSKHLGVHQVATQSPHSRHGVLGVLRKDTGFVLLVEELYFSPYISYLGKIPL